MVNAAHPWPPFSSTATQLLGPLPPTPGGGHAHKSGDRLAGPGGPLPAVSGAGGGAPCVRQPGGVAVIHPGQWGRGREAGRGKT